MLVIKYEKKIFKKEYYHFATPSELMDLCNDHQWLLTDITCLLMEKYNL